MRSPRQESFIFAALPARVVFGPGMLASAAEEVRRLQRGRAFVISGPQQAEAAQGLRANLGSLPAGIYTRATMHTPVDVTEEARTKLLAARADVLVALGGGSAIGLAKALALRTGLPQIVIPTTYAGSEMTPILGQTAGGKKTTVRDLELLPEVVIYDPELTYSLPPALSANSGMNAIAHAVEALYAKDRNPVASLMATEAIGALSRALPLVVRDGRAAEARADALYGAWLCGSALGSVGMALHHKLCHVLGGSFDLPHAPTHAVVLPHAASFNAQAVPDLLAPVADLLGSSGPGAGLYEFGKRIGASTSLAAIGMPESGLDRAAEISVQEPYWNPRPVTKEAVRELLDDAWHGRRPKN